MADEPTTPDPAKPDPAADPSKPDPDATSDLGDAGKKALDSERSAKRAAEKRAKDAEDRLKAIEDKDKSDSQRLTEERDEAKRVAAETAKDLMRHRVGVDKRLPAELVELLKGDTEEEMAAHADRLSELVKQQARPRGDVDQGRRGDPPKRGPAQDFADFIKAQTGQT